MVGKDAHQEGGHLLAINRFSAAAERFKSRPLAFRAGVWLVVAILFLSGTYVCAKAARRGYREFQTWRGLQLNKNAWEAGFLERGKPVPPDGPRDGYWGVRLGPHTVHPTLGWILPKNQVPELLDIDDHGMQYYRPRSKARVRLLIVGASTAFGGYASTQDQTYFSQLGKALEQRGLAVEIGVQATGAWKSEQEIKALQEYGWEFRPDMVLFLDALNDVTNGSNGNVRYGIPTATLDGSRWQALYHEHDYSQRLKVYHNNMMAAWRLLNERHLPMAVVLQPALFEKKHLSAIEEKLLSESLLYLGTRDGLSNVYAQFRSALADMGSRGQILFVDCSQVFDGETATVFTDIWHFSDIGHTLLGLALADRLEGRLRELAR